MSYKTEDILIVGAGPVGLTLACCLAKNGIRSRIIDKRSTSSLIPRAMNINNKTLDIFKYLEINDFFWAEGIKLDELIVYWNKKRFINIDYKFAKISHPYFFHLEQCRVEAYLHEILNRYNISIEREITLDNLIQGKNSVTAYLKDKTNKIESRNYTYLIGCDGGTSTVRDLINISCQFESYSAYFVLMDAEIEHQFSYNKIHYYLNEDGYLMVVPLPKNKYRLIASFKGDYPGKENVDLSLEFLQKILDKRGPGHLIIKKSIWTTSAGFYHKLANDTQSKNVFLAGDAMHLFSPVGGTNMNTGIQDAFCLANKIASVKNENKGEMSLEEYRAERLAALKKVRDLTSIATNLLTKNKILPNVESKYYPSIKNRKFLKITLPKIFAGVELI